VADEKAWSVGLSCGGEVSVWVEPHWAFSAPAIWQELRACVAQRRPAVLLTQLQPAPPLLVEPDGRVTGDWGSLTQAAVRAALEAYQQRESQRLEVGGVPVFAQVFPRPAQLLLIGAGHIAVPLVQFARALDFETIVMDPRRVFASQVRFPIPPHRLLAEWPHERLSSWDLNEDTYAVLLTHDPKIDDPALHLLLKAPVAYIGALGSRKTHAQRCARLQEAGFSPEEIARIKGPIGLDIRARTPAEIALSIMAQVVAVRRAPPL
jgi:xanthine dehydrogenase accessory factor